MACPKTAIPNVKPAKITGNFDRSVRNNATAKIGPTHSKYCGENTLLATINMKIRAIHTVTVPSADHVFFTNPRTAHATANTNVSNINPSVITIAP